MPTSDLRFRPRLRHAALALAALCAIPACSNDQAPGPVPGGIAIVSGDAQYTRKDTQLEEPVAVRVTDDHGTAAPNMTVHFQVIEGGGRLSHASATTNNSGRASVRWTVGPSTGNNRMRITVSENSALSAVATATSSEYYCPEEDPAFSAKFGGAHNLMMLTRQSSLTGGLAGLVRYDLDTADLTFTGTSLQNYTDSGFLNVVRDCVFSANGDLFISWVTTRNEVVKVATNGLVTHFATLEPPPIGTIQQGAELAMTPNGVLVGCDVVGPFYVTCRDTLFRFEDAIFSGDDATRDQANNDALACDPTSGDVYFIYKADRDLMRIPFDGTTAGSKTKVADLSLDETDGARGMVVDGSDGSIYILVQSAGTKSIVKVTSAGVHTTEIDLSTSFPLPPVNCSDLAIDRQFGFLYTLDTESNHFLLYRLSTHEVFSLAPVGDVNAASDNGTGERVGLDVIPAAGP